MKFLGCEIKGVYSIETGRFRNIKLEDRLCTVCNLKNIESEIHLLFECPCYDELRAKWLQNVRNKCHEFDNLNVSDKLCIVFNQFHRCTAKFILKCFECRKSKLFI